MKEEALKLADYVDAREINNPHLKEASAMIRRLVEELDKQKEKAKWFEESNKMFKETRDSLAMAVMLDQTSLYTTPQTKPLSEKELYEVFDKCYPNNGDGDVVTLIDFARAIEERHGIK